MDVEWNGTNEGMVCAVVVLCLDVDSTVVETGYLLSVPCRRYWHND